MERYKQEHLLPPDQVALDNALTRIQDSFDKRTNFPDIFEGIALFDRMGRTIDPDAPAVNKTFKILGNDPEITQALFDEIQTAHQVGDDERVMVLIRVSHLMGHTEDPLIIKASNLFPPFYHPLRTLAGVLGQNDQGSVRTGIYDQLFEEHRQQLEAKRQAAAGARARTRTGTGARRAQSPDWTPENITGKSPEWSAASTDIEAKWQTASQRLPKDGSPRSTSTRFEEGFNIIHQEMLRPHGPNGRALQAMIEYLIPHIWIKPDHVEKFLQKVGRGNSITSIPDLDELAQALFIPRHYRTVIGPLNQTQKEALVRIYRRFGNALHSDLTNANPDTNKDPNSLLAMEELFKAVNNTHDLLKDLLK